MFLLQEIISTLETWAPLSLQESYDNSGLLVGNREARITKALIALDLTEAVMDEAIGEGCELIITHHPFLFSGVKKLTGRNATERMLIKAIRNELNIYAIHTNLDNVERGVNAAIGQKLGLENISVLRPLKGHLRKLVTFCPEAHASQVREAVFAAGAGHIGNYDQCSFNLTGQGTFRAGEGANPFVGNISELHFEKEIRIETIYPAHAEQSILRALFKAHPYEEVAYDIYPLENVFDGAGAGMTGEFASPMEEEEFLKFIKEVFGPGVVRHSALLGKPISRVAYCGGSGSFLIPDAIASGAQAFITGDVKYHQFFDAESKILIADVGHYESEQFTSGLILAYLMQKFPTFALQISKQRTNSVNYF